MIFVTNKTPHVILGRHYGVNYEFKPKERVAIDEITAEHIFGYGLDDKMDAMLRLGWQGPRAELEKRLLETVSFQQAEVTITPVGHAA